MRCCSFLAIDIGVIRSLPQPIKSVLQKYFEKLISVGQFLKKNGKPISHRALPDSAELLNLKTSFARFSDRSCKTPYLADLYLGGTGLFQNFHRKILRINILRTLRDIAFIPLGAAGVIRIPILAKFNAHNLSASNPPIECPIIIGFSVRLAIKFLRSKM